MTANTELGTVDVVTTRPIIQILPDKTVFNVQGTLNATGVNGFDLLRKAPGLSLTTTIILCLKKIGVQVYVDNKPTILSGEDLVNYLKSMQRLILIRSKLLRNLLPNMKRQVMRELSTLF